MHFRFVDRVLDYTLEGSPALRLVKGFPLSDDQLEAAASASRGVPNSLVLETMAQGGWLLLAALREYAVLPLLLRINEASFAGIVRPGDRMVANASLVNYQDEVAGVRADAWVGDRPVAGADLLFVCLTQEQLASRGQGHVIRGIMDRLHGSPLVPGLPPRSARSEYLTRIHG